MMVESSLSSILKRNGLSKISSNMSAPLRFYSINEALLLTYIPQFITYKYPYIRNQPLQPFLHDYCLSSYTTYIKFVNFIYKWRYLQFNVDHERQIFESFCTAILFRSQSSFCQKSAERKLPKKYFLFKSIFIYL